MSGFKRRRIIIPLIVILVIICGAAVFFLKDMDLFSKRSNLPAGEEYITEQIDSSEVISIEFYKQDTSWPLWPNFLDRDEINELADIINSTSGRRENMSYISSYPYQEGEILKEFDILFTDGRTMRISVLNNCVMVDVYKRQKHRYCRQCISSRL